MGKAREFELRFNGLHGQPEVVARTDGELRNPREVVYVIEKSAYQKAVDALKRIVRTRTRDPLAIEYRKIARETLKELGEL